MPQKIQKRHFTPILGIYQKNFLAKHPDRQSANQKLYTWNVRSLYQAYVDESSARRGLHQQDYIICAVLIEKGRCEQIRENLSKLLLRGQRKLHWTDESTERRKKIVEAIASLENPMHAVITHRSQISKKTERFRRKCLEELYYELVNMEVYSVYLESRQSKQNEKDIAHIVALQDQNQASNIIITHKKGSEEPLLWIADVVLGAINADFLGDKAYLEQLQESIVLNKATRDSEPIKERGL